MIVCLSLDLVCKLRCGLLLVSAVAFNLLKVKYQILLGYIKRDAGRPVRIMLKYLRIALNRKMVCGALLCVNLSRFELVNRLMKFAAIAFSARLSIASC